MPTTLVHTVVKIRFGLVQNTGAALREEVANKESTIQELRTSVREVRVVYRVQRLTYNACLHIQTSRFTGHQSVFCFFVFFVLGGGGGEEGGGMNFLPRPMSWAVYA